MRKFFQIYSLLLCLTMMTLTSCLGSSNEDSTTVYDDAVVTSFQLGTLNKYTHQTTAAGTDTVYKSTVKGSSYSMSIDQVGHRIFNRDSLPVGTDVTKVVCTLATLRSGIPYFKSLVSDTLWLYSSTDSVDFSQPRILRVFSNNGAIFNDYTVTLNVHQQGDSSISWTQTPAGTEMPQAWMNGWEFAINAAGDGIVSSSDHWATTIQETLDTDASLLPASNESFACWKLGEGMSYALMVGDCPGQEKSAVVWRKVIDTDKASSWVYMPLDENNAYYLPKGYRYWLLPYNGGGVLAIGADGTIYQSRDQGITWKKDSKLTCPVQSIANAVADEEGVLWLLESGETGTVWRGVINE